MNSTIQCLRKVRELTEDMKNFKGSYSQTNKQLSFLAALRDTYRMLDINGEPVRPLNLVVVIWLFYLLIPVVFETSFSALWRSWWTRTSKAARCRRVLCKYSRHSKEFPQCWVGQELVRDRVSMQVCYYTFTISNRLTNQEAPQEQATATTEVAQKLSCHIDNENNPISYLQDGIKLSLTGTMIKNSPTLGRDATYLKTMKISKLVLFRLLIYRAK